MVFYGFETLKQKIMSTEKDLNYWKANSEEDYKQVPISVLRYITELETAVKNCSIPDVSGISLEKLKLQKECYRERKERNGKSTAYGEAHTDEIREGVIDHLIALCNYR